MPATSHRMTWETSLPMVIGGGGDVGTAGRRNQRANGASSKLDFGEYLLSASPPVNFAFSYAAMRSPGAFGAIIDGDFNNNEATVVVASSEYNSNGWKPKNSESWARKISAPERLESAGRHRKMGINGFYGESTMGDASRQFSEMFPSNREGDDDHRLSNLNRSCLKTRSWSNEFQVMSPTPYKRKVSFADDLGYRLYVVRVFEETPDTPSVVNPAVIQRHVMAGVTSPSSSLSSSLSASSSSISCEEESKGTGSSRDGISNMSLSRLLMPNFSMPAANYAEFRAKVEADFVSLESVHVSDQSGALVGTIKVKDIAFEKSVFVRYTFDKWSSHTDVQATYVAMRENSSSATSRRTIFGTFSFRIEIPGDIRMGAQFAVCYRSDGNEFWDNNSGANYELVCPDWVQNGGCSTNGSENANQHRNTTSSVVFNLKSNESWTDYASWNDVDTSCPYY